jgi:hypothetical protein
VYQGGDERMELAQAAGDTWQQLNRINSRVESATQVEKIE